MKTFELTTSSSPVITRIARVLLGFCLLVSPMTMLQAQVFSDDFELGWGGWTNDAGVWEVGVPTSGPGSAHEGTNVAATVLGGDYPLQTDSRLISPTMVLPMVAGDERAELRFWQWFNYDGGDSLDKGHVQVSVWNGSAWGAWVTLATPVDAHEGSSGYRTYNSGWSKSAVELTAYAGQTVRLAFYHVAGQTSVNNGSLNGWYLDEVTVWKGVPQMPVLENFEGGWGDWSADHGVWQIGVPTTGGTISGTNVAGAVLSGSYPTQTDSRLISPTMVLPTVAGDERAELRFWQWFNYDGGDSLDKGHVQVSVWNGSAWGAWVTLATPVDAHEGSSGYRTYNSGWSKSAVELTAYAGQTVRLAFYHVAGQTSVNNGSLNGWYLDEVTVWKGVPQMPVLENFEGGWGDWSADHGVWQIGVPTTGGTISGTNVAGAVLSGSYPTQTDSRLISPTMVLPTVAGDERAELRFWQWFNYDGGDSLDKGHVQVSVWNGSAWGAWVTLATPVDAHEGSSGYRTYNSGWSKSAVELTAYAGQTVRLAFYHVAGQTSVNNGSLNGWYLDEVTVWKGVPQMPVLENFEGGWGDWSADHGVWQIGVPTTGGTISGTNVAGAVLSGSYPTQTDSRLISPTMVLPTVAGDERAELRFWQWFNYDGGDSLDKGHVQVSVWNGSAWGAWVTLATPVDAHEGSSGYRTYNSGWSKSAVELTAYAGQTVRLAFYHVAGQTSVNNGSLNGWYLDEVTVWKGVPQMPVLENFEGGWGDWSADHGVWQIGVPITGGTISGSRVAATVLTDNYPSQTDSRLISPPFLAPPAELNPEVRFWQTYSYAGSDNGQVQISQWTGSNWTAWVTLATPAVASSSSGWILKHVSLAAYGGKTVRIAFFHTALRSSSSNGETTGWHLEDVEIVPNFTVLLGSSIMRTGEVSCVSVSVAAVSPVTNFTFTMKVPAGHVPSLTPSFGGRFVSEIIVPGSAPDGSSQWAFNLTTSAANAVFGSENIGAVCFTPNSIHSAFVQATIEDVAVPLYPGWTTSGVGRRWVIIANESLLEPWLDGSAQRMVTHYGKANTNYVVRYSSDIAAPSPWTPGWTNTMPANLFYDQTLLGSLSNAPVLFLRAQEQ